MATDLATTTDAPAGTFTTPDGTFDLGDLYGLLTVFDPDDLISVYDLDTATRLRGLYYALLSGASRGAGLS